MRLKFLVPIIALLVIGGWLLMRVEKRTALTVSAEQTTTGAGTRPSRPPRLVAREPTFTATTPHDSAPRVTSPSQQEPVSERMLGERVERSAECERVCRTGCYQAADGAFHCPRACKTDNECDPHFLCMSLGSGSRCLRSECSGSGGVECGPGRTCVYVGRMEGGIYRCREAGTRTAGQFCLDGPKSAFRCGPDQVCSNGTCLTAQCRTNSDCGKGSICGSLAGGGQERTCVPFCTSDSDCPAGRACAALPSGTRLCGITTNAPCLRDGCPGGQVCHMTSTHAADLRAVCAASCDRSTPSACPGDQVCVVGLTAAEPSRCARPCRPGPGACPAGEACVQDSSGTFYCRPFLSDLPEEAAEGRIQ